MEIFQIAAFVLVSVILISLVREYLPSYGLVCLLGCSICLLMYLLKLAVPAMQWLSSFSEYLNDKTFSIVLKASGIALASQTTQDLCRDAGMGTLAGKIEFAGRCLILVCTLPLFQTILESLVFFLQ